MLKRRIVILIALSLVFASQIAYAFFDPPWIMPAAPRAGETVSVNIQGGICDVFVEWPGYPQVTQIGNALRIVQFGNHETFEDFCIYGLWTVAEPIGTFAAGNYTLTVDFAYDDALYGPTIITLGVVPFTVTDVARAASVPASSPSGLLTLLLFVFGLALCSLRTRRRNPC